MPQVILELWARHDVYLVYMVMNLYYKKINKVGELKVAYIHEDFDVDIMGLNNQHPKFYDSNGTQIDTYNRVRMYSEPVKSFESSVIVDEAIKPIYVQEWQAIINCDTFINWFIKVTDETFHNFFYPTPDVAGHDAWTYRNSPSTIVQPYKIMKLVRYLETHRQDNKLFEWILNHRHRVTDAYVDLSVEDWLSLHRFRILLKMYADASEDLDGIDVVMNFYTFEGEVNVEQQVIDADKEE